MSEELQFTQDEIRSLIRPRVYRIMKDLSKISRYAIQAFYDDYEPEYYERCFGLKDLFSVSTKEIKNGYQLTFHYDAEYVQNKEHHGHGSTDGYQWAFETAFVYGQHGGDKYYGHLKEAVPIMTPSPWNIITSYVNKTYRKLLH